jgi:iron complex transport system ATP-binding protein
VLRVENVCCGYGHHNQDVIKNISFEIDAGMLAAIFGPNGCGKTTLFKCCLNFIKKRKGSVYLNGLDTRKLKIRDMARLAAYVPQEHKPPFPYLVKEVVLMGRTPHATGLFRLGRRNKQKAMEALDILGIVNLANHPYNQLSGGQRQMVLIARAIAQETKLIFLDEPTSALDFKNQINIWRIMRRVVGEGVTILACSHDPNHVAWFCDKVVVMNGCGIIADGPPMTVFTQALLDEVYEDVCRVKRLDGVKMILPAGIAVRKPPEENTVWFHHKPI